MIDQILIIPNALTAQQCDQLVEEYETRNQDAILEKCMHAMTGELVTSTFKRVELQEGTLSYELMFSKNEEVLNRWIEHLKTFDAFNIPMLAYMLRCSHTYRLMKYDVGGWIHPHTDWGHFIHASCTFALNDEYSGGDFCFFNGKHSVKLKKGDAMVWPANCFWVHEVKPVTEGSRYSTNSFICSLDFDNIKKITAHANEYMSTKRTYRVSP